MKTKLRTLSMILFFSFFLFVLPIQAFAGTFSDGGDRLVDMQQDDGGWDWPLYDGDYTNASPKNTAAPIAMGLLAAYEATGDSSYLDKAIEAGEFIKAESPPHSTANGIFMGKLSEVTGDTSYATDVKEEFYDKLDTGGYTKGTTNYSTSTYAQYIYELRVSQGNFNLGLWDVGLAAAGAAMVGASSQSLSDWQTAIETGLVTYWQDDYSVVQDGNSVIGLAGAIYGLSELGVDTLNAKIVSSNALNGATTLTELVEVLLGYQTDSGAFSNYASFVDDIYTGAQVTAYAIIALASVDADLYEAEIAAAASWLSSVQLSTGGWSGDWEADDSTRENNEVTGEALWALGPEGANVPEPATMMLFGIGLLGLAGVSRKKRIS